MGEQQPLVSICMITYNHEAYIAEAIEGVLMQKADFSYRLVIGEDCSTDNTRKICEDYAKQYPDKIELLPSIKNLGMQPNFIRTFEACTGKYVALCEGDDYWTDPLKLQKQVDFLEENKEFTLCTNNANSVNEHGESNDITMPNIEASKEYTLEDILINGNPFYTASSIFRKSALFPLPDWFLEVPFGDYALYIIALRKGKGFCFNDNMSAYRCHLSSSWNPLSNKNKVKKNISFFKKYLQYEKAHENKLLIYKKLSNYYNYLLSNSNCSFLESLYLNLKYYHYASGITLKDKMIHFNPNLYRVYTSFKTMVR